MKAKIFFVLMASLILSSKVFSMDPRGQQVLSGVGYAVGAAGSEYWAQQNTATCAACEGMCWACVWKWTGHTGALANSISAGDSFYQATQLSSGGGGGGGGSGGSGLDPENCLTDPTQCIPNDKTGGGIPTSPEDINKLKNATNNILNMAQQGLDDLKNSGHWPPGIDMNDPDALQKLTEKLPPMTEAEKAALQDYENKKAKLDSMSTQEKVDSLLSGEYGDYGAAGSRMIAGSEFEGMENFDPNSLLAMLQNQGMESSAPGYYGNVPLQVLNPHSKLSLFQRVSLKMKNFR